VFENYLLLCIENERLSEISNACDEEILYIKEMINKSQSHSE
jgi:hypothetical protein